MFKIVTFLFALGFSYCYAGFTLYSGSLPRPVLFVHGINSDMGTWGAHPAGYKCVSPVVASAHYDSKEDISGTYQKYYHFSVKVTCADGAVNTVYSVFKSFDVASGYPAPLEDDVAALPGKAKTTWTNLEYGKAPWANRDGLINDYRVGSASDIISTQYGLSTDYKFDANPNYGINHNGLEYYNSTYLTNDDLHPFQPLPVDAFFFTNLYYGQTYFLFQRVKQVLDEYYGSAWQTDASMQIDIVGHSQGGLIIRNLFSDPIILSLYAHPATTTLGYTSTDPLANPISHIRTITTLNTPHLGTAAATTGNGVSSIEQIRTKVISMYNANNYGSIHVGWWWNIDIDPGETVRKTLGDFIFGSQFLGYPKVNAPMAWEPPASNMGSTASIYAGSDFITDLRAAGFPVNPYTHQKIPLTAYYGRATGLAMKLINYAKQAGYDACNKNLTLGVNLDDLLWYTQPINGSTCIDKVNGIVAGYQPIFEQADRDWSPYSDFIVDVSSQRADGLFDAKRDPFTTSPLTTYGQDLGSPHMSFDKLGTNGTKLRGASEHGEDIIFALEHPPRQKTIVPALTLLLLN